MTLSDLMFIDDPTIQRYIQDLGQYHGIWSKVLRNTMKKNAQNFRYSGRIQTGQIPNAIISGPQH
jgi:hypothetical protein